VTTSYASRDRSISRRNSRRCHDTTVLTGRSPRTAPALAHLSTAADDVAVAHEIRRSVQQPPIRLRTRFGGPDSQGRQVLRQVRAVHRVARLGRDLATAERGRALLRAGDRPVSARVHPEWHSLRVTPDDAAAIRAVAARFGRGEGGTSEMCSALRGSLHDLCGDTALEGDFFRLFTALESWDVAAGTDRESAAETARTIARHLGRGA
jgi:hypothetical protein